MAIRNYKLELTEPISGDVVAFGPRSIGESGRDILIVKKALGQLKPFSQLVEEGDQESLSEFEGSWLDCSDGSALSSVEASIFDRNMQSYLTRFQLDNQFYILCYLFSKFSVNQNFEEINDIKQRPLASNPGFESGANRMSSGGTIPNVPSFPRAEINEYLNSTYTATQLDIITGLFDTELGKLGEATLAVMHGWRPRTKVGNTSYFHDSRIFDSFDGAYDMVLLGLYSAFTEGLLTQKVFSSPDILSPRTVATYGNFRGDKPQGIQYLEKYKQQVSAKEAIQFTIVGQPRPEDYVIKSSFFGAFKYRVIDEREKSPLYNAFIQVSEEVPRGLSSGIDQDLSDDAFRDALYRAYEPNPLLDPDPFVLDKDRIVYFHKTEYALEGGSIPPDPEAAPEEIKKLEEVALEKVLNFYGKPLVWVLDPANPRFETLYGYDLEARPRHNGSYAPQDKFVLTTENFLNKQNDEGETDLSLSTQDFRIIEGDDVEPPLIKFVEFISPSLRPTDRYRARFIINRNKLDNISEGVFDLYEQEVKEDERQRATTAVSTESTENINQNFTCDGEPVSKEEQERRYKEYKALAAKRKQEIARTIREKTVDNYNNKEPISRSTVDLGVFGNTRLNLGAGDSYTYTSNIISTATGALTTENDASGVTNPKLSDITEIEVTFIELQRMCESVAKNLTKAYDNCLENNIAIKPRDFNGKTEARRLRQLPGELRAFIEKRTQKKKGSGEDSAATGSNFDFGTDDSDNLKFSGFFGGGSRIKFKFIKSKNGKGLKVESIFADNKDLVTKNLIKEVKSLAYPRTVGYLGQLHAMSTDALDLFGFRSEACQALGLGKFGLAYIMKHTVGLTSSKKDEFNPISKWATNEIDSLRARVKEFKSIGEIEKQLNVKFGVDDVLKVFGKQCSSLETTMRNLIKRFSFGQILCDLLRCIRFPAVSFNIPDLRNIRKLLSLVDISIFGWYKDLIENLVRTFYNVLTQFLCTFAKALIDILNQPFCKEQLRDQLYGSGANSTSPIKRALVEGLTDLSLSAENVEKSKDLIDSMAVFLTGEELCRVLQGGPIDGPTMNMIMALAENLEIEETDTEEKLKQFFQTISIFLPPDFCENLNQSTTIIDPADCSETATYASQVRRRLLANEATDDEIDRALEIANKNLQDQFDSLKAFGSSGISGIVPKVLKFGDSSAMINTFPEALSEQLNRSAKSLFTPAHTGYVSSLSRFGPSLFENTLRMPQPGTEEFNQEAYIITQTILQNLRLYTALGRDGHSRDNLLRQLHVLYQVYEVTREKDSVVPVFYLRPINATGQNVPQDLVSGYRRVSNTEELSEQIKLEERLFLNPVGFLESNYYFEDPEDGSIINPDPKLAVPKRDLKRPLSGDEIKETIRGAGGIPIDRTRTVPSYLDGFSFIGAYKMMEKAEKDGLFTSPSEGVDSFLLNRIQIRLGEMQAALQTNLQNIATPINESGYLKTLKESLSAAFENEQERRNQTTGQLARSYVEEGDALNDGRQILDLRLGLGQLKTNVRMSEFPSAETTSKFDPYIIEIGKSPLLPDSQSFEFCDTVPGPGYREEELTQEQIQNRDKFERLTENIPSGIYTRREIFARKFWESVNAKLNFIYDRPEEGNPEEKRIVADYMSENSAIKRYIYDTESVKFTEGIIEQLFYALENSRIYDQDNYYDELNARVAGLSYADEQAGCFKNRYNISQFGILSFEKMVTDEVAQQLSRELAKPENDPYNRDFDDLEPVQKAVQNVCMIGFIRVCIVELMLKGSLAYSVWDMESVADEPFMREFFIRFVEEEIKRHPSLSGKWQPVASRISGVDQPQFAIRDLVEKQLIKVLGVSKKIFKNQENLDYYNWFVRYFIPQTEVSNATFGGVSDDSFEALVEVDTQGRTVSRNLGEGEPGFQKRGFLWSHPLGIEENIITQNDDYSLLRDAKSISQSLLTSQNRFFHIEHLIEVTGPLAQLESLVIPSRTTAENIIRNIDTNVGPEYRDRRTLTITKAYERTNLAPINLDDYNLRNIPEIQTGARGTSAEDERSLNENHEIYNIDDFVSGLKSALNKDDLEKIVLHHRGLMHYDESENAAGGPGRNTTVEAANGMPSAIRNTPTRFVTKIRRIIKFSQDFVSHEDNSYFAQNNELSRYKQALYSTSPSRSTYAFGTANQQSEADANTFKQLVAKSVEDQIEYYILTSNGEELVALREQGIELDAAPQDAAFLDHLLGINPINVQNTEVGSYVDYVFEPPRADIQGSTIAVKHHNRDPAFGLYDKDHVEEGSGKGRNITKNINLENIPTPGFSDFLLHKKTENSAPRSIFENLYGKIGNLEDFNRIRELYESTHSETWVETVFEFSGDASIIAGFHGSFSIGETADSAVRTFHPNASTNQAFEQNSQLIEAMTEIYGPDALGNAQNDTLSFNRTLMFQENRPYIARHMGIAIDTNDQITKYQISEIPGQNTIDSFPSFVLSSEPGFPGEIPDQDYRKNIITRSPVTPEEYNSNFYIGSQDTNVLPPNFYKIPMRVLITQVYDDSDQSRAREVYCKVVPPEYIRGLYDPGTLESRIDKLNQSLTSLALEYVRYRDFSIEVGQSPPDRPPANVDFTTDFFRDHNSDESSLNFGSRWQYCSIESIYSRAFEQETYTDFYNSKQELDNLFADRGSLLIDRPRPEHGARFFPGREANSNVFVDAKQYLESCNHFYEVDTNITEPEETSVNFHNTIFSLSNVFQWYLRNRRRDTLWGQTTPPLSYIGDEALLKSRRRPATAPSHFPRNQSFRIGNAIPHLALPPEPSGPIPGDVGSSEVSRRADQSTVLEEGLHSWVPETGTEVTDLYLRLIGKKNFERWNFYSGDTPGLISDGVGSEGVNYNYIEHCPFKNTGTSLFYGNGIISQADISNFISSCVRKIIAESSSSPLSLGHGPVAGQLGNGAVSFFSIEEGINIQILSNMVKYSTDNELDLDFKFSGQEKDFTFPGFVQAKYNPEPEQVNALLLALKEMFLRLYRLSASQAAFSVKTEASRYNREILESPYKFAILARFISKIQDLEAPYTPAQRIFLLSLASAYNFSDSVRNIMVVAESDQLDDLDNAPDEELMDWAAACLHFCAAVYQRHGGNIPNIYGEESGILRVFSYSSTLHPIGRNYFYRKRGRRGDGIARDSDMDNLMFLVGDWRAQSVRESWNHTRHLIDAQDTFRVNRTSYTIKQIIRLTNSLYHDLHEILDKQSNVEGESYGNNSLILEALLDPEINTQDMIDRYGDVYRSALSRANVAQSYFDTTFGAAAELLNNRTATLTRNFLQEAGNPDSAISDSGQIEEFVLRLDNRLFYNLFGLDSSSTSFPSSMKYFKDYFEEKFRPKRRNEKVSDYYREMMPVFLYRSQQFTRQVRSLSRNVIEHHMSMPQQVTDRWNQYFSRHTGISNNTINLSIFQDALISGQVITGLLENSEIKQVCRLVSNTTLRPAPEDLDEQQFNSIVNSTPIKNISEEFRTFRMITPEHTEIFSVPMAEYSKMISPLGEGLDDCYDILKLKEDYKRLQPWMAEQLIETDEAKQIFQYIYPVKRYQALITAFVTSGLAGYGNMVNVMQTPKASLAALLGLAGLNRRESTQVFDNFSQAEFMKQIMDSNASENALNCFGFPFPDDFLKQFEDLLAELFSQFPSIFFRGIAQAIDPAYKEMRTHYMNCHIDQLTMRGLENKTTAKKTNMTAGIAHDDATLTDPGKYGSVIYSAPVDIGYGIYRAFWGDWDKLRLALERLTGYIIKGPVSLVDGAFNFTVPCVGVDESWSSSPWNADRYGHPLTPFTLLALLTNELPGDRRLRSCTPPAPDPNRGDVVCPDEEDSPFGDLPDPDE